MRAIRWKSDGKSNFPAQERQPTQWVSAFVLCTVANILCLQDRFGRSDWRHSDCFKSNTVDSCMPRNGETNQQVGFYINRCCGKEIVVPKGDIFPDCPDHPGLTTIWEPTADSTIVRFDKRRLTPRFQVGDQVIFVGIGAQRRKLGGVIGVIEGSLDHVHRYDVRLSDGTCIRCFGFELELIQDESARSA
jgi:hypothetical protein